MRERERPAERDWSAYFKRSLDLPLPEETAPFLTHFEGRDNLHLLDFGCGNGRWGAAFDRDRELHGISNLTIDVADQHLDKATLIDAPWCGKHYHTDFVDITLEPQQYDGIYDGIIARHSIMFQDREGLHDSLNKCADALKPQGVLYFTIPRHGHTAREKGITCMSRDEIRDAVNKTGLELLVDPPELNELQTIGPKKINIPMYHVYARKP